MPEIGKKKRVRDTVHGLITFGEEEDPQSRRRDLVAWKLLNTPEFQRLRRIRQLGVSEFTFPGASHTRFAHSIGVFHTAKKLVALLQKQKGGDFDIYKANIAVFASLVHDLGHGPFSHAFESAQEARGAAKNHENWTSEIILNPSGSIFPLLEGVDSGLAAKVADLLRAESPSDEYHAVVSSSFDADRLDYLRRDRMMTGTGAGAIDFDWLLDNIRIDTVSISPDDEDNEAVQISTFCIDEKAIQAAESFLLARYHLFSQVYIHKTTRSMEIIIGKIFETIAERVASGTTGRLNLSDDDPLVRFFAKGGETLENFLKLDDFVVWHAVGRIVEGECQESASFGRRFLERRPLKCIDINSLVPIQANENFDQVNERRLRKVVEIDEMLKDQLGKTVFKDSEPLSIYGEVGSDESKRHKKLSIRLSPGITKEITQLSPTIRTLAGKRPVVRYFFLREADRSAAKKGLEDHGT